MGEARRRIDRFACGEPYVPAQRRCPSCGGTGKVRVVSADSDMARVYAEAWSLAQPTPLELCAGCGRVWEAKGPGWIEDVAVAKPCDNCAFRRGSPELNRGELKRVIEQLELSGGEFYCHKGVPVALDRPGEGPIAEGAIRFDFPKPPLPHPLHGGPRLCAGFMHARKLQDGRLKRILAKLRENANG